MPDQYGMSIGNVPKSHLMHSYLSVYLCTLSVRKFFIITAAILNPPVTIIQLVTVQYRTAVTHDAAARVLLWLPGCTEQAARA
mmetsp:Transcript_1896/g.2948  ORF Transcript_1896/g.2948 Transcript_1896/m.2948 type:complete len:83 (-) Transcript_1896:943-1191(-)